MFSPVFLNQSAKKIELEDAHHFVCLFHNKPCRRRPESTCLRFILSASLLYVSGAVTQTRRPLVTSGVVRLTKGEHLQWYHSLGAWPQRGPLHRWQQHLVSQCWIKVVKCDVDALFTVTVLVAWQWSGSPTYECITVKAINLMLWIITAALPVAEATLWPLQAFSITAGCCWRRPRSLESAFIAPLMKPHSWLIPRISVLHAPSELTQHSRKQREGAPCHWAWTWESLC